MGNLTDDMTRLRGEIDALRNTRGALMQDLARGAKDLSSLVSVMRADFSGIHGAMAKKEKEELRDFVSGMISTVSSLLADSASAHADMNKSARAERRAYVADVKKAVNSLRKNTAEDMEGARQAWRGPTATEKRAAKQAELKELKRRDTEARKLKEEQVRQASELKRQEEEQFLAAEAETRKLKEEKLRRDVEIKRREREEELRLAAEAAAARQQDAERFKKDESQKPPEAEKKKMTRPASKGRKGKE